MKSAEKAAHILGNRSDISLSSQKKFPEDLSSPKCPLHLCVAMEVFIIDLLAFLFDDVTDKKTYCWHDKLLEKASNYVLLILLVVMQISKEKTGFQMKTNYVNIKAEFTIFIMDLDKRT